MINVKKEGIILQKSNLRFENEGVMNPAAIKDGDTVHMFYRAVRKGNYSTIGYCRLQGPLKVIYRSEFPILFPQFEYEKKGVEDPRIVKIGKLYYLTYTAYDGTNATGALAESKDLEHFTKKGIITSCFSYDKFKNLAGLQEKLDDKYRRSYNKHESESLSGQKIYLTDKNLVFFPRRINGKLWFLHRIKPDIQWVAVDQIEELTCDFWENYFLNFRQHILLKPENDHEASYVGAGCPPIETPDGWILIYHGVHDTPNGYVYSACAALLALENPSVVIARLPYPLFFPEADYELKGIVNQVCFPTATALFEDTLYIYYGAADKCVACASVKIGELVNELIKYKK